VAHVEHEEARPFEIGDGGAAGLFVDVGGDQRRAFRVEASGDREAKAGRRPVTITTLPLSLV